MSEDTPSTAPGSAPEHTGSAKGPSWLKIVGLVLLVIFLLGVAAFVSQTVSYYQQIQEGTLDLGSFEQGQITRLGGTAANADRPATQYQANVHVDNYADDPALGPEDAPVTIVAFEDFECPFCLAVFPTLKNITNRYPDIVRFIYRDFPLSEIHPNAFKAAEAGNCAHEQGQFWPYHDKLYRNQTALSVADLKQYAVDLNLNTSQFDNCLDTGKYKNEVEADFQDGLAAGVTGTPTFFINGSQIAGVVPEDGFDQIITFILGQ